MRAQIRNFRISSLFLAIIMAAFSILGTWSPATATTYNDFISGDATLSKAAYDPGPNSKIFFMESRKFDFSSSNLNAGNGVTLDDKVNLFTVPKGTYLMGFGIRVLTATVNSGTSCTIGDSGGATTLVGNTSTGGYQYIRLDKTNVSGASIWQCGLMGTAGQLTLSGVSLATGSGVLNAGNMGAAFSSGVSCYDSKDTIYMTVKNDKLMTNGATPIFEAFIWGFKKPLE